ncbi:MAG: membrane protein insertase YidC [Dongiaceae bacterium]
MEQRNLIIAMVLMAVIWVSYFTFFAPQIPPPEQVPAQQSQQPAADGTVPVPGATTAAEAVTMDRATALAQSRRVRIESPRISGSIALKGGRIDDVVLTDYHVTVDRRSPNVILLSPAGAPDAYFAEAGWISVEGAVKVPDFETVWQADGGVLSPGKPVTLTWDNGAGQKFTRIYALDADYMFTVTDRVENTDAAPITVKPFARVSRTGTPKLEGFYILHEGFVGIIQNELKEADYSDLQETGRQELDSPGGWVGITDKYWLAAVIAPGEQPIKASYSHSLQNNADVYQADFVAPDVTAPPGGAATATSRIFAGAKEVNLLDQYKWGDDGVPVYFGKFWAFVTDAQSTAANAVPKFDFAVDWGWFRFLTKPIFWVLDWLFAAVGNFGIAILILTVIVKALFFPLANKSYTAMSKMKRLTPQMQALRERLGDDKVKLNQEMMALYKREKVNPAAGCLPIIVQIPVFFALYKVLFITIEMRHAPFYGWIKDLSAPDPTTVLNLFGLLPYSIPDLGFFHILSIGVWPIIMGVTMFLQQKINPPPPDPVQARMFMMLPFIFTFMLGQFAAGLVIYWAWNNLLSIAQQWVIMRRVNAKASSAASS